MDDLDQRIDALYAGAPGEFTAGRDALAKDLRAAGEQDEAARVRRLRRPTKIAAELNRLARAEPGAMGAAIDAEDALEAAQRGVLEGTGSADDLRAAEQHEAEAIAALSADPAIRAALRLAARSPDAREDLRRGRTSQDPEADPAAALFGMGPVSLPPRPASAPRAAPAAPSATSPPAPQEDELAAARAKRERVSARQAAETEARAAARAERTAKDELTRARRRAGQAAGEARRAGEALERATRELGEAQAQAASREEESREAAEAEAAAEAAVTEAAARREAADRASARADENRPSA